MPKFKEGDVVYCRRPSLKDTLTDIKCGTNKYMEQACSGFPMTVCNTDSNIGSVRARSDKFEFYGAWNFHEDDLEFFGLSLENK